MIKFCDFQTLSKVRNVWLSYAATADLEHLKETTASFKANPEKARHHNSECCVEFLTATATSAAPVTNAVDKVRSQFAHHWSTGSTDENVTHLLCPNPLFASPLDTHHVLGFGMNPTPGFHLAAGLTQLTESSPLRPEALQDSEFTLVNAANVQLLAWAAAHNNVFTKGQ